jgi:acid phosphatase family membrane protein YuiD
MKKLLTGLLLSAALISPAMAVTKEDCADVSGLAESIMSARLAGISIVDSMGIANTSGDMEELVTEMVKNAYSEYAYKTEEYKESAIKDFGAKYYLDCLGYIK